MLSCGIDFGTSNTLAAVALGHEVAVVDVDPGNLDAHLLPTLLYFSRHGWHRVGRDATHAYRDDPDGRFIRALKSALPDYGPEDHFRVFRDLYNLPELAALVLRRVKAQVETVTGAEVAHATIGRPVRFSPDPDIDRGAEGMLRAAAETAGFQSIRFLSEPEAATRYFSTTGGVDHGLVLVFDFGGGTLDLCLARLEADRYQVLQTNGAHIGGTLLDRILFEKKLLKHLGQGQKWGRGLDLPRAIFNRLVNPDENWRITETEYAREVRQILNASHARGSTSPQLRQFYEIVHRRLGPDLFSSIEAAKMALSSAEATEIRFEAGDVCIAEPLTRSELHDLFAEQLGAIRRLIRVTLEGAGFGTRDVDRVVLAGGSSALICTQELLLEMFGAERVPLRQDLFTSIVSGLALHTAAD